MTPSIGIYATHKQLPRRGTSQKTVLHLSLEESTKGCVKRIEFTRTLVCKPCEGSGNSKSSALQQCNWCHGEGKRITLIDGKTLVPPISTKCKGCDGVGYIGAKDCLTCTGGGRVRVHQSQSIQVSPGTITGMSKVFVGEGDEGYSGGPNGTLVLLFEVEGEELLVPPEAAQK